MLPYRVIRDWRVWLVLLLVVAAVVAFRGKVGRGMADFDVYRTAGARVLAGEALYRESDGHWQFKYLPAFAFVVAPLAVVPAPAARAAWFILSILLLIAMLALSVGLLPGRTWNPAAIVGVTVLALGKFYAHELTLGQTNILLGVVVLAALALWRDNREAPAGALLAAATVVKPYALVFLPYLIARRPPRAVAAFGAILLAALLLPAVRYGVGGNLSLLGGWWHTVAASTVPNLTGSDNISIAGMWAKWIGAGSTAAWLAIGTACLLVAAAARALVAASRAVFPEYLDAALLLTLIPLLSPQGWDYVLLLATPAVMLLFDRLNGLGRIPGWLGVASVLVAGLTLFDLVGRRLYALFMVSSAVTVCYLVVVALLLRLRERQLA